MASVTLERSKGANDATLATNKLHALQKSCDFCVFSFWIDRSWTNKVLLQSTNYNQMTSRVKLHKSEKKREQCDVVYELHLKKRLNRDEILSSSFYVNCLLLTWLP